MPRQTTPNGPEVHPAQSRKGRLADHAPISHHAELAHPELRPHAFNDRQQCLGIGSVARPHLRADRAAFDIVITDNAKCHHATLHRDWRQEHERSFPLDYLPPYSPDPEPQSRCRPLCVNPRAVRTKGGPRSISSTYNSLTLCEDFVRIVLVGRQRPNNGVNRQAKAENPCSNGGW